MLPITNRAAITFAALMLMCGCSRQEYTLAPVEGVVTKNGKPAAKVRVVFFADGDTIGPQAIGRTDAEGRYRLGLYDGRVGAPVGQHRVCLIDSSGDAGATNEIEEEQKPDKKQMKKPRIPPEYAGPATTPLRAEVKPAENQSIDFQIP